MEWRTHPKLQGRFPPEYPDDLQVLVHDGGPAFTTASPELVWVTVTGIERDVFAGRVLNQPQQLETIRQGQQIRFVMALRDGNEYPLFMTDKFLSERDAWTIHPCEACGSTELLDAPSDLMRATFPDLPQDGFMAMFTTRCPDCDGTRTLEREATEEPDAFEDHRAGIDPTFLRPDRLEYLTAIASVLPVMNRRRRVLYLLSGSDFVTSYLLSGGADRTIMIDRLPFHGRKLTPTEYAEHKRDYFYKKHELNFAVEPDLLPEVGCLQYLLWEFEAMGIGDTRMVRETLVEDSRWRSYALRYRLPGSVEKCLVYYEIQDARAFKNYPEPLRMEISDGIDCLIRKAAVNVKMTSEVLTFIAAAMNEQGLMFVDDQSRGMLDDSGALFCPMHETAMDAIRKVEASRSILFGYNPVSVYQSIPARRAWEVDRRFRLENLPVLVVFLNRRPSLDFEAIEAILERTQIRFVLVGDAPGADALAKRYPERFFVEATCTPETLRQRYLRDAAGRACVLGDDNESTHFAGYSEARYFVTSSADYPYLNYRVEDLIAPSLLDEEGLAEHERIFCSSLCSNRYWLRFDTFRHISPHAVEAELSNFSHEVLARLCQPKGSSLMGVSSVWVGDVLVVQASGQVRENAIDLPEFEDRVMRVATVAMKRGNPIVFDLSKVDYINSCGLRTLMQVLKASRPGTRFAVAPPENAVARERYDTSRFDMLFPTYPTVDEAIAAVMPALVTDDWKPLVRALVYAVQFEPAPEKEVDCVLARVIDRATLGGTRSEYLAATRDALNSPEDLSVLIPQQHPDAVIRGFLRALENLLVRHLDAR